MVYRLFLVSIFWLIALSCLLVAQPKVDVIGGTNLDFGNLYTGNTYKQNVTLRNIGTDTLIVTNVSASCGCTGTLMTNDHIVPGDSGVLSITFNPSRFGGKVEKAVTFDVNDTTKGHVRVVFKANVIKVVEVSPEYLMFRITQDSTGYGSVTIKNIGQDSIHILSAMPSSDDIQVTFSKNAIQPGGEREIEVSFKPKSTGTVKGTLNILTDDEHVPTISMRYFALVSGESSSSASSSHQK